MRDLDAIYPEGFSDRQKKHDLREVEAFAAQANSHHIHPSDRTYILTEAARMRRSDCGFCAREAAEAALSARIDRRIRDEGWL